VISTALTRLSLPDARRIAVRGQGLAGLWPRSIVDVVRAQLALQIDLEDRAVVPYRTGILRINAVHWGDAPVDIDEPVASLAGWLGAHEVAWP